MTEYKTMDKLLQELMANNSDRLRGVFRFIVRCEACGKLWHSTPVRFTMATIHPENENKQIIYDALWKREWTLARDRALQEALTVFNLCPICKKISCEACFRICADIDMCAPCAEKLGEPSAPVHGER